MGAVFVLSWLVQSVTRFSAFAEQQLASLQDPGTWAEYVVSLVILTVHLRQRSSPELKPVGEAYEATGASN